MHAKIGIIAVAVAGFLGLMYVLSKWTTTATAVGANAPGIIPSTPINPIPVNLPSGIANLFSGIFGSGTGNPSPVTPTSITGGAVVPANIVQGPSYSDFLSQQQLNASGTDYSNLPLSAMVPSLMVPQTAVPDSVLAAPAGIDPPGISTDYGNYGGTGDVAYA